MLPTPVCVIFLVLKSFNCVFRRLKGCLKFKRCLKKVSRLFQGSVKVKGFYSKLKGVSRKFKGCFNKLSRVFQLRLKGV